MLMLPVMKKMTQTPYTEYSWRYERELYDFETHSRACSKEKNRFKKLLLPVIKRMTQRLLKEILGDRKEHYTILNPTLKLVVRKKIDSKLI